MKINEIIDTEFRDTKFPANRNQLIVPPPSHNDLGAGVFGMVKQIPNNPHEVYKSTYLPFNYDANSPTPIDRRIDAYYDWVKAIAPYAKSNPYLPRVYVVDDKTDIDGKIKPRYQMEKLVDGDSLPLHAIVALYYKEVKEPNDQYIKSIMQRSEEGHSVDFNLRDLWLSIVDNVSNNSLSNPQIAEVYDIIDKLIAGRGYYNDVRPDNLMIRSTSIGPQIVFTDPVTA